MREAVPITVVCLIALAGCGKSGGTSETALADQSAAAAKAPASAATKALLATLPPAYQAADLDNGEAKLALCRSCHTIAKGGADMTGPNLWGVFGRRAASLAGFSYSDGLKATGIVWNAPAIDRWITNPRAVVPSTKMTYLGMESATDRRDVIAYLKVATSAPAS